MVLIYLLLVVSCSGAQIAPYSFYTSRTSLAAPTYTQLKYWVLIQNLRFDSFQSLVLALLYITFVTSTFKITDIILLYLK